MTALVRHVIDEPVPIVDGRINIKLPEYDLEIEAPVKRINTGHGAMYAQEWDTLPPRCATILRIWYDDKNWRSLAWEKNDLRALMAQHGHEYSPASFLARISELVGAEYVEYAEPEMKDSPHQTRTPPKYRLKLSKVAEYIRGMNRD